MSKLHQIFIKSSRIRNNINFDMFDLEKHRPTCHRPMLTHGSTHGVASPPASSVGLRGAALPQGRAHGAHEQSPESLHRTFSWDLMGLSERDFNIF
jgi:hypothetical protein